MGTSLAPPSFGSNDSGGGSGTWGASGLGASWSDRAGAASPLAAGADFESRESGVGAARWAPAWRLRHSDRTTAAEARALGEPADWAPVGVTGPGRRRRLPRARISNRGSREWGRLDGHQLGASVIRIERQRRRLGHLGSQRIGRQLE